MAETPFTFTWYGRRAEDLSREELMLIIKHLSELNDRYMTPAAIRANALGRVEMMKRGECGQPY